MLQRKSAIVTGCLAIALAAGTVAMGALAQPAGKQSERGGQPPAAKAEGQPPEWGDSRSSAGPLINVEFAGGTVAEFIEALRKAAAPEPVNAVVSEPASKVTLAPIRLRKVALETAVQSIETAAGDAGGWRISRVRLERRDRDPLEGESPVFSVQFEPRKRPPDLRTDAGEKPVIQVYSLRDVTDPKPGDPPGVLLVQKPETVLTAIRSAIELSGGDGSSAPEIKYHQDSGLLIVRGTAEQTGLISQALDTLASDVRQRRSAALQMGVSGNSVADMRAQMDKAALMAMKQQAEARRAGEALARIKQQAAAGAVSTEEVAAAEARAQNTEIEAQVAQVEVARLAERLRSLEEGERSGSSARPDPGSTTRSYDLTAWGDKARAGGSAVASALEKVASNVGNEHSPSTRYEAPRNVCIVEGEPWAQELARRVLGEYARSNGLTFDGAGRAGPGAADPARRPERGAGKTN